MNKFYNKRRIEKKILIYTLYILRIDLHVYSQFFEVAHALFTASRG